MLSYAWILFVVLLVIMAVIFKSREDVLKENIAALTETKIQLESQIHSWKQLKELEFLLGDTYITLAYQNIIAVMVREIHHFGMIHVPKMEVDAVGRLLGVYMIRYLRLANPNGIIKASIYVDAKTHAYEFRDIMDKFFNDEEEPTGDYEVTLADQKVNLYTVASNIMDEVKKQLEQKNAMFEGAFNDDNHG